MALASNTIASDDTAVIGQYNNLRTDVTAHTHEGTDTALLKADTIQTVTGSRTLTLPTAANLTLATLTGTETLTNKTLTSPVINTPTGIVKGDVGLGNVDNTSDATKNAATATLTNKTLTSPIINDGTVNLDGGTLI